MSEYLEDKKVTNKFIRLESFLIIIAFLTIVICLLVMELNDDLTYIGVSISVLLVVLILVIISKIENKVKKKYEKLFKSRSKYYVIKLDKLYDYENLVLTVDKIKNKKMYLKREDAMMLRRPYGFLNYNVYRINVINGSDFKLEEYQNRLKKLNQEYESKFGSDRDNYSGKKFYHYYKYVYSMHKINIIYSNELNNELIDFISTNFYNKLFLGKTSQTIVIIGDEMYVPSVRTLARLRGLRKHNKALNYIIKWFNIEA